MTRTRACAQANPTRVPDVVVMETPRPRAPGAGCSHSARSLLALERSGGHRSRAWGAPTATSPFWPQAPCSASTCGDQMLAAAEFDFPLSGTHACGRLAWEPVQSRPGTTHPG